MLEIIYWCLVAALFVVLFMCYYLGFYRNEQVYRHRIAVLKKVSAAARADIAAGNYDWNWRYEYFKDVSYAEQVLKFWKPLDSFWKSWDFIDYGAFDVDDDKPLT